LMKKERITERDSECHTWFQKRVHAGGGHEAMERSLHAFFSKIHHLVLMQTQPSCGVTIRI
jgi:hypothetical protein